MRASYLQTSFPTFGKHKIVASTRDEDWPGTPERGKKKKLPKYDGMTRHLDTVKDKKMTNLVTQAMDNDVSNKPHFEDVLPKKTIRVVVEFMLITLTCALNFMVKTNFFLQHTVCCLPSCSK